MGAKFLVERYPDLIRAGYVLNEIGGFTVHLGDARFYPIQVAEKGFRHRQDDGKCASRSLLDAAARHRN